MKSALSLAIIAVALDQLSKFAALAYLSSGATFDIVSGYFDLCLVFNRGAAWGMLAGKRMLLIAVSIAMCALLWSNRSELTQTRALRIATGLLIGGIAGNLIDRLFRGYVIDFIDVHIRNVWAWPAFNIADSAICTGVAIMILHPFFSWFRKRQ